MRSGDGGVEKEVQVGLFHIQVHGHHRPVQTVARDTVTVVLPVPPLPLATATIIVLAGWLQKPSQPGRSETAPRPGARSSPSRFWPTLMPAAASALKALGPT